MGKEEALKRYQDFKRSFIAGLPQGKDFEEEFELEAETKQGGKGMTRQIIIDKDTCVGCGLCEQICPEAFKTEENIPCVIDGANLGDPKLQEAIDDCPVGAITLKEVN